MSVKTGIVASFESKFTFEANSAGAVSGVEGVKAGLPFVERK